MRDLLSHHFGAENVIWAAGEGLEPTEAELKAEIVAFDEMRQNRKRSLRFLEIAAIERVMSLLDRGEPTGLTDAEIDLLPALLKRLRDERV